jgi:hypothetical protein
VREGVSILQAFGQEEVVDCKGVRPEAFLHPPEVLVDVTVSLSDAVYSGHTVEVGGRCMDFHTPVNTLVRVCGWPCQYFELVGANEVERRFDHATDKAVELQDFRSSFGRHVYTAKEYLGSSGGHSVLCVLIVKSRGAKDQVLMAAVDCVACLF